MVETVASITQFDRGLLYGHGAFETITLYRGHILFKKHHIDRLIDALQRLFIPLSREELEKRLEQQLAQLREPESSQGSLNNGEAISGTLKVIVTAGSGPRGYYLDKNSSPSILFHWFPNSDLPLFQYSDPINVLQSTISLAEQPLLAGMKHLNRLEQVLAAAELQRAQSDHPEKKLSEGLLCAAQGGVIEGIMSNIFLLETKKGESVQLVTPKLDRCGVRGVLRRVVMEEAVRNGYTVLEEDIDWSRVTSSSALFMTNASQGIRRVAKLYSKSVVEGGVLKEWCYSESSCPVKALWQALQQRIQLLTRN